MPVGMPVCHPGAPGFSSQLCLGRQLPASAGSALPDSSDEPGDCHHVGVLDSFLALGFTPALDVVGVWGVKS